MLKDKSCKLQIQTTEKSTKIIEYNSVKVNFIHKVKVIDGEYNAYLFEKIRLMCQNNKCIDLFRYASADGLQLYPEKSVYQFAIDKTRY